MDSRLVQTFCLNFIVQTKIFAITILTLVSVVNYELGYNLYVLQLLSYDLELIKEIS